LTKFGKTLEELAVVEVLAAAVVVEVASCGSGDLKYAVIYNQHDELV